MQNQSSLHRVSYSWPLKALPRLLSPDGNVEQRQVLPAAPSHVGEYGWVPGVPGVLPATAGISLSWGEVANSFSCLPPPPAQAMIKEVPFHIFKQTNKTKKSSSFYLLVSYLTKLGQRMFLDGYNSLNSSSDLKFTEANLDSNCSVCW